MNGLVGQPTVAPAKIPRIADHELFFSIASGGYGEVWCARNIVEPLRGVEVVRRDQHASAESFDREFKGLQKFEPVSRAHEGLVDILTLGRLPDGAGFYYVMELADDAGDQCSVFRVQSSVPGPHHAPLNTEHCSLNIYRARTLRHDLKQRGYLPVEDCLQLGLKLAAALAHLHAQGLVHRDVKPSNILFIGGEPKLADAGLVAAVDDARSLVGTAGYIAPEGPGTPQADLYALGKVLYEAAFGKDRQDFPQLPPDLRARPDHARLLELNAVILKACATDPRERYQTAEAMQAELELLQRGESVKRQRFAARRRAFIKRFGLAAFVITLPFVTRWVLSARDNAQHRLQRQEAHQLYLEGRKHADRLTRDSFSKAVELYHQAIALDPAYARPYVGLAETYVGVSGWHLRPKEAMAQAKREIAKALELDPRSAPAHFWLARIQNNFDWDWAGAEKEFRRSIELAPDHALGYFGLSSFKAWMGRFAEAEVELATAQRLAKGPNHRDAYDAGILLFWQRKYDQSLAQALKTLPLDTNSVLTHSLLTDCYLKMQCYEQSIAEARILRALDDSPFIVSELGHIYAVMGRTNEARACLQELEHLAATRYVSRYFTGFVHLGLGEKDKALDGLEAAYEERFGLLVSLKVDPFWDDLRGEPRFKALLKKLKLEN